MSKIIWNEKDVEDCDNEDNEKVSVVLNDDDQRGFLEVKSLSYHSRNTSYDGVILFDEFNSPFTF